MDPNETLRRIRAAIRNDETGELAELVEALDDWLSGGGFLPSAWGSRPYNERDARAAAVFTDPVVADRLR